MSRCLARRQAAFTRGVRQPAAEATPAGLDGERFEVYRDLVFRNLEGLLAGGFPVLKASLGDHRWASLIREFLTVHRAQTPLFLEVGAEFVTFLAGRSRTASEPEWLHELAHYERIELELAVSPAELPDLQVPPAIAGATLRLSPLAKLLAYRYPVHRIGPANNPPPAATFLLVYRDADDEVNFLALQPATAQLLALIEDNENATAEQLLARLATELQQPAAQLREHGLAQLEDFIARRLVYSCAG